jgi:hypothetical protein
MTRRESDPLIVLRAGSAVHTGKGRTARHSPHRKPGPACRVGVPRPTSLRAIATKAVMPFAEASLAEEPGAGKPHAGICAGGVG